MRTVATSLLALALLLAPRAAFACPVCFGQSDAPLANAMNQGILFMLVVVVCMLAAFAAFFIRLARRERLFDEGAPARANYEPNDPQEGTV